MSHLKRADVATELLPHQQRVVDRLREENQPGLVVAHGLGSGKTLTSIAAQEALGMPSTVVLPASLRANYEKEREKHLKGEVQPAELSSLQGIARKGELISNPLLIVDEAHRLRDPATSSFKALRGGGGAEKRMLLTATPFYNDPSDIAPLVNIASGQKVLPLGKGDFRERYVYEQKVTPGWWGRTFRGETPGVRDMINPRTVGELRDAFHKYVDYHPSSQEGFPEVKYEDVNVQMTPKQLKVYDSIIGAAPPWVSAKIKSGLPPSKQEAQDLNAFLTGARQVALSTAAHAPDRPLEAPKIQRAFEDLQKTLAENERAKAVIYSNYLESGLDPYAKKLQEANIPFGMFRGDMKKKERDQMVKDYNEGKLRTLMLSSAGGEGLDLKGTRLMQILEPHWNVEKIRQVEGRGIRYGSHEGLAPEERNVSVKRYLATRPPQGVFERIGWKDPGMAADQYLMQLGAEKERLNEQFRQLLPGYAKTAGITKEGVLWHALAGPVGHVVVNLAGRAAHHGSNLAEFMAHKGLQHGAVGSSIAPAAMRSVKAIAGPESVATYGLARQMGEALYKLPPVERQKLMQAISSGASVDHPALAPIRNSPVLGDLLKAVRHDVAGTSPKLEAKGMLARGYSGLVDVLSRPTTSQFDATGRKLTKNLLGAAPAAAMAAVDPVGSAAHFGVNTAREMLAKSRIGKHVMDRNIRRGLSGRDMSPLAQAAIDIGASPAFLDPYRMGRALHEAGVGEQVLKGMADVPVTELPNVIRQAVNTAKQYPAGVAKELPERAEQVGVQVRQYLSGATPPIPHPAPMPSPLPIYRVPTGQVQVSPQIQKVAFGYSTSFGTNSMNKLAIMTPQQAQQFTSAIKGLTFPSARQALVARTRPLIQKSSKATQMGVQDVGRHVQVMQEHYPDILDSLRKSPLAQRAYYPMDDSALVQNFLMSHRGGNLRDTARSLGVLKSPGAVGAVRQASREAATIPQGVKLSSRKRRKNAPEEESSNAGLLGAGAALGGIGMNLAGNKLMGFSAGLESAKPGAEELASKLLTNANAKIRPMFEDNAAYFGHYTDEGGSRIPVVGFGKKKYRNSPGIVAHELGHAAMDMGGGFGKAMTHTGVPLAMVAPMAGNVTGALSGMSDDARVRAAGIAAPVMMHLPQLYSEGGATLHGLRNIRRTGGTWGQVARAAGTTIPAFATYASAPLLSGAGAYFSQKDVTDLRRAQEAEKAASAHHSIGGLVEAGIGGAAQKKQLHDIAFPLHEHADLRARLEQDKPVYTTRISSELDRYQPGMQVKTPWGQMLRVDSTQRVGSVKDHPFHSELTDEQKKQLHGHDMSVVKLVKTAELAEDGEHKLQGHLKFQGLRIAVENKKGSVRSGVGKDGKPWRTVMKAPYGYLEAPAKGKDGDSIDVYVGPKKDAPSAFVVHQHKENGKGHDEDKVILGVGSLEEAKKLYLKHYDSPKFLGPVSEVPVEKLKELVNSNDRLEKISAAHRVFSSRYC